MTRRQAVSTVKKSIETKSGMVGEELAPGLRGLGAPLRHEPRRCVSARSIPSFKSSAWMRGVPHKGFVAEIFLTRAAISALMQERPRVDRPES
jgi:DNA-binding IclR family transcriptional regulator